MAPGAVSIRRHAGGNPVWQAGDRGPDMRLNKGGRQGASSLGLVYPCAGNRDRRATNDDDEQYCFAVAL